HPVRAGFRAGMVRSHRSETDTQRLDLLAVEAAGGDHRLMSSGLQAEGNGEVRVQVAQRAERREDDPPPGGTGTRFGYNHGFLRDKQKTRAASLHPWSLTSPL